MAYDPNNLSALAYANGFTLWHYKTADPAVQVDTAGYFDDAVSMLRVGDFIVANTAGTTQNGIFIVKTNDGTVVDTSNLIDFSSLNTD